MMHKEVIDNSYILKNKIIKFIIIKINKIIFILDLILIGCHYLFFKYYKISWFI